MPSLCRRDRQQGRDAPSVCAVDEVDEQDRHGWARVVPLFGVGDSRLVRAWVGLGPSRQSGAVLLTDSRAALILCHTLSGGADMSNILTDSSSPSDSEQDTLLDQLFEEMQRLNEEMRDDQDQIDRLKMETRVLSEHSDRLLEQIEAQLASLRKAS